MNYLQKELTDLTTNPIFDFLQETVLDGFWYADIDKPGEVQMSDGFWRLLGFDFSENENVSLDWKNYILSEDEEIAEKTFAETGGASGGQIDQVLHFRHKNGQVLWLRSRAKAFLSEKKRVFGVFNDVSRHFEAKKKIGEDSVYILRTDLEGNYTYVNDLFVKKFGKKKEKFIGKSGLLHILEEDHPVCAEVVRKCLANPMKSFSTILRKPLAKGGYAFSRWGFTALTKNGEISEIQCIGKETNEGERKRQALLEQNQSLALIKQFVNLTTDAFYVADESGKLLFINKLASDFVGISPEEAGDYFVKDFDKSFVTSADWKNHFKALKEEGERTILGSQLHLQTGRTIPVETRAKFAEINGVSYIIMVSRNISRRHELQAKLLHDRYRFEEIIAGTNLGTWEWNVQTGETILNEQLAEIIGYTLEEISPVNIDTWIKYVHPDDLVISDELFKAHFEGKTQYYEFETRMKHKDGRWIWVLVRGKVASRTKDGEPLWVYGSHKDITERKNAEADLLRTKEFLERTNRSGKIGAWEVDLIENTIYWSEITKEIHEVPADFVPTLDPAINFYKAGESREKISELFGRAAEFGENFDDELQLVTQTGREVWVRAAGHAILEKGKCVKIFGTFQDIDKRKRAEIELSDVQKRLEMAAEGSEIGVWDFDFLNQKIICNDQMYKLYGLDKEKAGPGYIDWYDHVHPEDLPAFSNLVEKAIAGEEKCNTEFRVVWPDGTVRYIRTIGTVLHDENGKAYRMVGTNWDISKEKLVESELINTKKRAVAANRAKSEFLANMSHEIRTPLNGVIGFTDLLLQTKTDETQEQYLHAVFRSANLLLDIINDILDFSKIEAGKMELSEEKIDLFEICTQITDVIRYGADDKGLEFLVKPDWEMPHIVRADPVRLRQILINLLGNAVKFTSEGEVELKITAQNCSSKTGKCNYRFSIRDTGIGIPEAAREKIFQAFAQGDSSTTKRFGGTGLGLNISNKLLELMGSRLQLKAEPAGGSMFFFDLVLNVEEPAGKIVPLEEVKSILIADAHTANREIIENYCRLLQIEFVSVKNGMEALQILSEGRRFDVVIADYKMPFMNGIETVTKIRNILNISQKEQEIVLLCRTDFGQKSAQKLQDLGIKQAMMKPIGFYQFSDMLRNLKLENRPAEQVDVLEEATVFANERPYKVLIVEDNLVNMLLAKSIVSGILPNVEISEAENGKLAVTACETVRFDFIFMDIQMPEMNGYEASRKIRQIPAYHDRPIVALTAGTVKGEQSRCLAAGMDDYVSKPVIRETIKRILSRYLGQEKKTKPADSTEQIFDKKSLLETLGGDSETMATILTEAGEQLKLTLVEVENQLRNSDFPALYKTAHRLKGMALNARFLSLGEAAKKMEESARNGRRDEIRTCFEQLRKEIRKVSELI